MIETITADLVGKLLLLIFFWCNMVEIYFGLIFVQWEELDMPHPF